MARWLYTLAAFTALAAWAGAQTGAPAAPALNAEDKLRLLKANSTLIDSLVSEGVAMANPDPPVKRVEQCRNASRSLVNAIQQAAEAQNAERVAELTNLFRDFVREGLVPTLDDARRDVTAESPDGKRLRQLRDYAATDLADLKAAIGKSEKVNDSPRVKDAVKDLEGLTDALK